VQELRAAGAEVFVIDVDPRKVDLARELGAADGAVAVAPVAGRVLEFTGGVGADSVVITAASKDRAPVDLATDLCARGGRMVLVGVCDVHLDRQRMWEKQIEFVVSRASGPGVLDPAFELKGVDYPPDLVRWTERRNLSAFLDLVGRGQVSVDRLTTHRFPIAQALDAYELVQTGREPFIGVMLSYPPAADARRTVTVAPSAPVRPTDGTVGVAVVGAGLFARAQFLPALAAAKGVRLEAIAGTQGVHATHLARKFGFARSTTAWEEVLDDPRVDAVFVLTRHDQHARMVIQALAAGKHVFVEKPLCMTPEELDAIAAARAKAGRLVMVGYNRRFSSLTRDVLRFLGERRAPSTVTIRVNAGSIPPDHWAHQADEGGGRIVSEGCHFVDLAIALTGELPVQVLARAATAPGAANLGDEACLLLAMDRGSVVQILYTGAGDRSFSRERVEVFRAGAVAAIDDFRSAELCRDNSRQVLKRFSQDLGYEAEVEAFLQGVRTGVEPISFEELAGSTLATLKAVESMRTGAIADCRVAREDG
jgi:predicted dehydrogenase